MVLCTPEFIKKKNLVLMQVCTPKASNIQHYAHTRQINVLNLKKLLPKQKVSFFKKYHSWFQNSPRYNFFFCVYSFKTLQSYKKDCTKTEFGSKKIMFQSPEKQKVTY